MPLLHSQRYSLDLSSSTLLLIVLRTRQGETGSVLDLRNFQLSLGRRFRSLKVWFVLRSYGLQGFRAHLRRSISQAENFEKLLFSQENNANTRFQLVTPGSLSLRVFRVVPVSPTEGSGGSGSHTSIEAEEFTRRFYAHLSTPKYAKKLMLTQTTLPEIGFCIRFVTGSPWTREEHIVEAVKVLNECYDEVSVQSV